MSGLSREGEVTRAAMVLLTWPELELVEYQVARVATTMPYIPAFSHFAETPALLAAWSSLSQKTGPALPSTATVSPSPAARRRQPFWSDD